MPQAVIIGPPGSGKTTVGKALAKSLHIGFLDTDKVVEKKFGKRISDIFVDRTALIVERLPLCPRVAQ